MARWKSSSPWRGLLRLLWTQPLWAIPFALFFGTLFGGRPDNYRWALWVSLVFSGTIGLALWAVVYFIEPRIAPSEPGDLSIAVRVGAAYVTAAIVGSYVAAAIVHFYVMPGFLGSARAVLISGLYTLIFVSLFTGVNYAIVFYRQAVDRARAVEAVRAELAQAELRALRAQIHPHFLFNALNTIASLIATDPGAAEETVTRLADLFRYTLRASERDHASLGDELAFLRDYLAIEKVRFQERLAFEERIEPGLERVPVPSLLLQPLVENAVRHGIGSRPEGGTVRVAAHREGALLTIEVSDDGPGLDGSRAPTGAGFGLHAVRERLRVAGPPHALHIESTPGAGTRVRLTLPLEPAGGPPPALPEGFSCAS